MNGSSNNMFRIIQNRKIGFIISGSIVALSLAAWLVWGIKPGLDFTGGSQLEVDFTGNRPTAAQAADVVKKAGSLADVSAQPLGDTGIVLRMPTLDENQHQTAVKALRDAFEKGDVKIEKIEKTGVAPPKDEGTPLGQAVHDVLRGTGNVVKGVTEPIAPVHEVAKGAARVTDATGDALREDGTEVKNKF